MRASAALGAWRAGAVAVALAVAWCLLGWAGAPAQVAAAAGGGCGSGSSRLTVTGSGVVTGTPDLLTVTFDVAATSTAVGSALTADDAADGAVVAALRTGGVAAKDVQTTNLSIQPQYNPVQPSVVTGYAVDQTVTAKIRTLSSDGSVIGAAVSAGGDAVRVDGLHFSVAHPRSLQDRARARAVKQAVSHARAMARSAGERLGPICSLTDEMSTSAPGPIRAAGHPAAIPSAGSVPVQAGTEQERDRVRVVYALAPGPHRA